MKNKELFEKTVGILVGAYQNDTLKHGSCVACAVGNIIACNMGYKVVSLHREGLSWLLGNEEVTNNWSRLFYTSNGEQNIEEEFLQDPRVLKEFNSTGYTWRQMARVEYAFETAYKGLSDDDWMFNGLIAVYDVLCDIHEVSKDEVTEGKLVFVK